MWVQTAEASVYACMVEVWDVFRVDCAVDEVVRREGIRSHVKEGGGETEGKDDQGGFHNLPPGSVFRVEFEQVF